MDSFIKKYVDKCKTCMLNKGRPHSKQPLRRYPVSDKFFNVVSTDLIDPLPITSSGKRYILVVTDFLGRYVVVIALSNKTADATAKISNHDSYNFPLFLFGCVQQCFSK